MHFKLLPLFALVSVVRNHDVLIGSDGGRLIFEDTRFASPAIWRQVENVTVIAAINEVISKVNITDLRADKDGDVNIVSGGEGEKSVTIEIKSPTVLRGYEFHIEVFSAPASNYKKSENADKTADMPEIILNNEYKTTAVPLNNDSESSEINKDIPTSIANDSDALRPARETNDENIDQELPEETEMMLTSTETIFEESTTTEYVFDESTTTENNPSTPDTEENTDETTELDEDSGSGEHSTPAIPSDWLRPARETDTGNDLPEIPVENEVAITTTETINEDYTTIDASTPNDSVDSQDSYTEIPEVVETDSDVVPAQDINVENKLTITKAEANPEYTASSILEYIKSKEQGNRQIRRIEPLYPNDEQTSTEEENNENEDSSLTIPKEDDNLSDDTVDLVPPEIDAPYNDDFSPDMESTEEPIDLSTTEAATTLDTTDDYSTPSTDDVTSESSLEEKSRNSRNIEDNLENSANFNLTNETEPSVEPNSVPNNDKISSGIVLFKEDHVVLAANGKQVEFTLPIVLVIGNENNIPVFKIVEDSTTVEKDFDQLGSGMSDIPIINMDYEDKVAANDANDFGKTDEYSY